MDVYVRRAIKQMAEKIAREKFSPNIPLRAEDMEYKLLEKLMPALKYPDIILKWGHYPYSEIVEVVGPRGVGKTTNILGALNLLNKNDIFASGIYFDVVTGDIKMFDPRSYISREELEKKGITKKNPRELIKEAQVVVIDNWHYINDLTKIKETKETGEYLIDELSQRTLEELGDNKNIIISTEDHIKDYVNFTESENFKELANYPRITVEMSPPEFERLCFVYNVKVDEKIESMWNLYSDFSARSFVNMINKFGRKSNGIVEVKWGYVVDRYRDKIDESLGKLIDDEDLLKFVINNPVIEPSKTVKYILGGKYETEYWKEKLKEVEKEYLEISERLLEIENKEDIKRYFEIKGKLKNIKNRKSRIHTKFLETKDPTYLTDIEEYNSKIRDLESELKNLESNPIFKEYKKIKSERTKLNIEKGKINHAINILSRPPYNLEGEKLRDRIETLARVYDNKGQLRIDPIRDEFLNEINVGSYFNELLFKAFPELID